MGGSNPCVGGGGGNVGGSNPGGGSGGGGGGVGRREHVHVFGHTHFGWDHTLDGIRWGSARWNQVDP